MEIVNVKYDTIKLLSDNAFKIYMLKRYCNNSNLGVDYISQELSKSISTIRRGLKEIKEKIV